MKTTHTTTKSHPWRVLKNKLAATGTLSLLASATVVLFACQNKNERPQPVSNSKTTSAVSVNVSAAEIRIQTPGAVFTLHPSGWLSGKLAASSSTLDTDSGEPAQTVSIANRNYPGVNLDVTTAKVQDATGKLGGLGKQITVSGNIPGTQVDETVTVEVYDAFPNLALLSIQIKNAGTSDLKLENVGLQRHTFAAPAGSANSRNPLWTFEGASLKWGKDEIFPMPAKFSQENPFGAPVAVKDDLGHVGGGIPVVAFWSDTVGEAIGHIETLPLALSIPVQTTKNGHVQAGVSIPANTVLKPGEVFSSPRTFLAVYSGDFYEPLRMWSDAIEKEGLGKPPNNDENYAVAWCGWGYEFGVTPQQMVDTIPKLKELGIHWATLDDGWFNNYGDWQPRSPAFTGTAMQEMVKQFHDQGFKVQLWWLPLAVEDGQHGYGGRKFVTSEILKQHPDWLALDENGKPARMARNLATLCPALPEVREYHKQLTERFIRDWGFDGHKLDNIYTPPLCYNPKHHHKSPYDSVYAMGDIYKTIFETTRALKPDSVTQSCPCGTPPSLAWFRYMDQAVTADPVGAIQVRRRVKMYKALLGPRAAVYGDHVELTRITGASSGNEQDIGNDFASTLGTGGVLGTKFTWPDYGPKFKNVYLTPEKEAHWKRWIGIYNEKMLSKGEFLNLYVYGFDTPEAYAIARDRHIFYAFYSPSYVQPPGPKGKAASWSGVIELRGLTAGKAYLVTDYVNHRELGTVTGPVGKLDVKFEDDLLLELVPAP